jgi:hypothetical protein
MRPTFEVNNLLLYRQSRRHSEVLLLNTDNNFSKLLETPVVNMALSGVGNKALPKVPYCHFDLWPRDFF